MDISPDGMTLAVSIKRSWRDAHALIKSDSSYIRFYELDTWKYHDVEITREATSIAFSPEGVLLAVYPDIYPTRIALWNIDSEHAIEKSIIDEEEGAAPYETRYLFLSSDNKYVVASGTRFEFEGDVLRVFSIASGELITRIEQENTITAVNISPVGQYIAVGDFIGNIRVWDFVNAELRTRLVEQSRLNTRLKRITSVAYSHDGKLLATSSAAEGIIVWDANTQEKKPRWSVQNGGAEFVTFSPDDTLIAVHTYSGYETFVVDDMLSNIEVPIKLRSTNNGEVVATIAGAEHSIAFSTESDTVFTGGPGGTIRVWDAFSGVEKKRLNLKTLENWLIIYGVFVVIWFFFWVIAIRRDGFLLSLQIPLQAVAITIILTLLMWFALLVFGALFSGFPLG
jgi:WD40 repeat protein